VSQLLRWSLPPSLRRAVLISHDALDYHSFLCTGLPDDASKEAASWVEPDNDRTVLIDASTAFRVDENWVYGFPGASIWLDLDSAKRRQSVCKSE